MPSTDTRPPSDAQVDYLRNLYQAKKAVPTQSQDQQWIDWAQQLRRTGCWNMTDVRSMITTMIDRPFPVGLRSSTMAQLSSAARAHGIAMQNLGTSMQNLTDSTRRVSRTLNSNRHDAIEWVRGVHVIEGRIFRVGPMPRQRNHPRPQLNVWELRFAPERATQRPRWTRMSWYQHGRPSNDVGVRPSFSAFDFTEATLLTLSQAESFGSQYGFCARCGRLLTDPNSVQQGIGPVCIRYIREQTARRVARENGLSVDELTALVGGVQTLRASDGIVRPSRPSTTRRDDEPF